MFLPHKESALSEGVYLLLPIRSVDRQLVKYVFIQVKTFRKRFMRVKTIRTLFWGGEMIKKRFYVGKNVYEYFCAD